MISYLYAIWSESGHVKFGVSQNVRLRFVAIANACPFPCKLLGVKQGGYPDERALHGRLSHLRSHNEWYRISAEVDAELAGFEPMPVKTPLKKPGGGFADCNRHPLTKWRNQRGLSQYKAGDLFGVHGEIIGQIERGTHIPSPKQAALIEAGTDGFVRFGEQS